MNKLKGSLLKFGYIEKLANGDSLIHRLNPLLKIILALICYFDQLLRFF